MAKWLVVILCLLFAVPTAAEAQSRSEVRAVQQALTERGYNPGPVDGTYGSKTAAAIRGFESDSGYRVTGLVSPKLLVQLEAPPAQVVSPSPPTARVEEPPALAKEPTTQAEGKLNGWHVFTWPSGSRYEGEWRDDKRTGQGVYTWPSGNRYEGEWRDDKRAGQGVQTWADGDRYEGAYQDGKAHGFGEFRYGGKTYSGQWNAGCFRQGDFKAAIGQVLSNCP
jgi:hypothetical protein